MARVWSLNLTLNQGSDLGFDRLVLIGATEFTTVLWRTAQGIKLQGKLLSAGRHRGLQV